MILRGRRILWGGIRLRIVLRTRLCSRFWLRLRLWCRRRVGLGYRLRRGCRLRLGSRLWFGLGNRLGFRLRRGRGLVALGLQWCAAIVAEMVSIADLFSAICTEHLFFSLHSRCQLVKHAVNQPGFRCKYHDGIVRLQHADRIDNK